MISFSALDIFIIIGFFASIILIGFIASTKSKKTDDDFLLSGRKVGLFLFVLTNVATWYGGILGVGEFSYRYGLVSWFTQGLPYYFFALIFAFFFAQKIHSASLFTIPDKLEQTYGKSVSLISAVLIFILVSPAPYLLMLAQILKIIFDISYFSALLISALVSSIYLFKGGFRSNLWADAFSFFVMFLGFIIIVIASNINYGGIYFLSDKLPSEHLSLTGGTSFTFITVWFLIALWTFTDPGFHQRCYAAVSGRVAKLGIIISVFFWFIFDFLTNATGLYSRALLPDLENPVLAFPALADKILTSGLKGIFFSALIATVLSTLNSFVFLSATTFSKDLIFRMILKTDQEKKKSLIGFTQIGIIVSLIFSIIIALFFQSIVELWYTIGSICIPGLILIVVSSYYSDLIINARLAVIEIFVAVFSSIGWLLIRNEFLDNQFLSQIEPMIVGLFFASAIHTIGLITKKARLK